MNGYDIFAPTLDGLININADNITAENITTGSLNGISNTVIGYLSNARSSLQTQIDGITGVDFTVAPLSYIVTLTGDVQTQLSALSSNVAGIKTTLTTPPFSYLSTLRSDVQIQIDSIQYTVDSGVDFTVAPLLYIVGLTSDAQAQIDALTVITGTISAGGLNTADIQCNTLTAASYVNCYSGTVNATWSANKLRVTDDVYYPDGTFGASPKLQDIIDGKIALSTTLASTALGLVSAYIESQILIINGAITGLVATDIATGIRVESVEFNTRYISTDYTELPGGISLTGGNTYCSSNFRIGDEGGAAISLYPSGQISAAKFAGDECNVDLLRTDVFNSQSANGNMHIGSPSLTDQYVQRTITIGDNYPLANCTVKTTHDLNAGGKCRASSFNTNSNLLNLWIGDDGTDLMALPRSMILGDYFGNCTVNVLTTLAVGTKITAPTVNIATLLTVGAGISLTALTGVITATGLVVDALTINTSLNGMPIAYFNGTTSNIQAQLTLLAPLDAPIFTGIPTAPTADRLDDSTQIATTAYVKSQLYALRESETFIGIPRAPTAPPANNTTQLATTAFVQNQANSYISNVTLTGIPMLTIDSSPVLTDNSYRIASTAFVKGQTFATIDAILGATNSWTGGSNTFSGLVRITNTTATTSGITGALVVSGGVGIGDDLYVVGDGNFQGDAFTYDVLTCTGTCVTHNNTITGTLTQNAATTNISSSLNTNITSALTTTLTANTVAVAGSLKVTAPVGTASTSVITGAVVISGGIGISGNINTNARATIAGITTITNASASTSSTTGALIVGGGVGIGEKLFVADNATIAGITSITNATSSTNWNNGSFVVSGGVGIAGILNTNSAIQTNGVVSIFNASPSTSYASGGLVVSGGAGIAGRLNVFGAIAGESGITTTGGTVNLTSSGAVNIISQAGATLLLNASNLFQLSALSSIIYADGGHRLSSLYTTFCVGCSETAYAAYGIYANSNEPIYLNTSSSTEITASGTLTLSGSTIKCNSQMIRSSFEVGVSSYTFASLSAMPSIVWVTYNGADIYIPANLDTYYDGLVVTFRAISNITSFTIRISGGAFKITGRTSSVNGAAVLLTVDISTNYCARLMYKYGYWYDSRG